MLVPKKIPIIRKINPWKDMLCHENPPLDWVRYGEYPRYQRRPGLAELMRYDPWKEVWEEESTHPTQDTERKP